MNDRVKNLWVSALRSGEYKKTSGALCRDTSDGELCYCALGVLCSLYQRDKGHANLEKCEIWLYNDSCHTYKMDGCTGMLPEMVRIWAGLGSTDPHVNVDNQVASISELNDGYSMSFNAIADVIEKSNL